VERRREMPKLTTPNPLEDVREWEKEFEKEFRYEFCDGTGSGCYYDTAPKVMEFIDSILSQERQRIREGVEKSYQITMIPPSKFGDGKPTQIPTSEWGKGYNSALDDFLKLLGE
jgi:hypothetical protein